MRAYKGFPADITSTQGDGIKENCHFEIGETKEVPQSKTGHNGYHCCEYPFVCCSYYRFDGKNRFFEVEAEGSIDEDDSERIACTRITIIRELTPGEFLMEGIKYMLEHPFRENWKINSGNVMVAENRATGSNGQIAIARGKEPEVEVKKGCLCSLIREPEPGDIECARMFKASEDGRYILVNDKVVRQ